MRFFIKDSSKKRVMYDSFCLITEEFMGTKKYWCGDYNSESETFNCCTLIIEYGSISVHSFKCRLPKSFIPDVNQKKYTVDESFCKFFKKIKTKHQLDIFLDNTTII